ncbi:hypothetical protein [Mechercharimyces sp. CAU 1602]|uniref:hypothetical protein n=1 Tax=Mechercharimyces sp. CAU 1602 TaxID=2973933 RepID=UPI0021620048|nr:hypothetical protein [Mechercharimyces sp. CAU 1602]MCS1352710.1 hypothetical protein [Mechercharimyces sp. CAU 1602]
MRVSQDILVQGPIPMNIAENLSNTKALIRNILTVNSTLEGLGASEKVILPIEIIGLTFEAYRFVRNPLVTSAVIDARLIRLGRNPFMVSGNLPQWALPQIVASFLRIRQLLQSPRLTQWPRPRLVLAKEELRQILISANQSITR